VLEALAQMLALLEAQPHSSVELPELTIDLRKQGLVVLAAQSNDVVERVETGPPGAEPLAQILQIQVVLECRLEVVRCHQRHQVEGLRRLREASKVDDPVLVQPDLFPRQRLQELAGANAVDRRVDLCQLIAEGIDRFPIEEGGAAMHVELAIGIGKRQHGFLNGGVRGLTFREDAPGNEGSLEVLGRDVGPSCAKQRLVGIGALESHAIQGALGERELGRLEEQGAEDQVRLVPHRQGGAIAALHLPGPLQLHHGFRETLVPQKRDSQIVGRVAPQLTGALDALENLDGLRRPASREVDIRAQEFDVILDALGNVTRDSVECRHGIVRLILLEVNPGESVGRFVAYRLGDIALEHSLDGATRAMMHSIVELEVTDRKLCVVDVMVERIELGLVDLVVLGDLAIEALERFEVVFLIRVVERFSEMEIPEFTSE